MTREELAQEIAQGLIETGIEGGFGSVSCSTAGDYPSIGCSQWEGARADELLEHIPGGEIYMDRPYSNLADNGMLDSLSALLEGYYGQQTQIAQLAEDCLVYVDAIRDIPTLDDSRCVIYAGMWCPTSHYVVRRFLQNRADRYNLRSLETLRNLFYDQYAYAADCAEYLAGYANRAETTYQYVAAIDLTSKYGVPVYGEAGNGR